MLKPVRGILLNRAHPLARGLVGCWLFNEGTGNKVSDLSGNGNHGTLTNMNPVSDWVAGKDGYALDFDGTNDYANINKKLIATEMNASIFTWIKTFGANISGGRAIYTERSSAIPIWKFDSLDSSNYINHIAFTHRDNSSTLSRVDGAAMINDGQNHFVGVVKEGVSITLYVDGNIDNTGTLSGNDTLTVSNTAIGSDVFAPNNATQGILNTCFVYKRVLTAPEIMQLYINPYVMFDVGINPAVFVPLEVAEIGAMYKNIIPFMPQIYGAGSVLRQ